MKLTSFKAYEAWGGAGPANVLGREAVGISGNLPVIRVNPL